MDTESFIDIILRDVVKVYRRDPHIKVKPKLVIVFNREGFLRAKGLPLSDMDVFRRRILGIPYQVEPDQKELYKIEVTE